MDNEFEGSVNAAAKIASSGRWKDLNRKIVQHAKNIKSDKFWHFALFCSIASQTFSEYKSLKDTYYGSPDNDLSLLAWRARNLLELRIWATYFCRSEQNARRIYEDAGRDGRDIFKALALWGKEDPEHDWETKLEAAEAMLQEKATEAGIDDLDGTYKKVLDAAQECGLGRDYRLQFKIFSKFAHPTAFQLVAPAEDLSPKSFRDAFFAQGCVLFAFSFAELESYLNSGFAQWESKNTQDGNV